MGRRLIGLSCGSRGGKSVREREESKMAKDEKSSYIPETRRESRKKGEETVNRRLWHFVVVVVVFSTKCNNKKVN